MSVGAENLISTHRLYMKLDDAFLCCFDFPESNRWIGVPGRLCKTILLDFPLCDLIMVMQHEFFGHGARLRDFGISAKYRIDPPFPFGDGGGATFFPTVDGNALRPQQRQGIIIGGIEATEVLGRRLVEKSIACREWDHREALLYLLTYHDQTGYILSLEELDDGTSGHDIKSYVQAINKLYDKKALSCNKLRNMAYINYLDPMTYLSFRSLTRYWWDAEKSQCIPMIPCGPVEFLPGLRLTLAPYGPEYGLHTYLAFCDTVATAYLRYGETAGQKTHALGFQANNLWKCGKIGIGARIDLWNQPHMTRKHLSAKTQLGALIGTRLIYRFCEGWSLFAEVGGKTRGFVVGEPLDGNIYLRTGVALHRF